MSPRPAVASGSYRVRFTPSDYNELGGYIATFYNGQNTLATASTVEVVAPAMQKAESTRCWLPEARRLPGRC